MQAFGQLLAGVVGLCEGTVGGAMDRLVEREGRLIRVEVARTAWAVGAIAVACALALLGAACAVGAAYLAASVVVAPPIAALAAASVAFAGAGMVGFAARRLRSMPG